MEQIEIDCNKAANELLENFWRWRLENNPEFATFSGFHEYDNKLEIYTMDAIKERKIKVRKFLDQAMQLLSDKKLNDAVKENLDFLVAELKTYLVGIDAKGYLFPICYLEGPHLEFERLISAMPLHDIDDYNKLLARYRQFPVQISQMIDMMKEGIKLKMTFHEVSVGGVPRQIERLDEQLYLLLEKPEKCIFYKPFTSLPDSMPTERKETLLLEAVESITHNLLPAFKMLKEFIEKEYLRNTRPKIGVSSLPKGDEFYQMCLDFHLSIHLSPEEIHEIGHQEVWRILGEMEKIIRSLELNISVKEFCEKMRKDEGFHFENSNELLEAYKGLVFNKIQPLMKRVVTKVPKGRLLIQPRIPAMADSPIAFYLAGTFSGSRPGVFYVDISDVKSVCKYEMMSLALHETLPGHHLQAAYLMECENLAMIKRYSEGRKLSEVPSCFPLHTAYIEGWGLYSESLGYDLDLYDDPYFHYGHLCLEMLRAARLVVDTGIHAFGWSQEKAINYMMDHTAMSKKKIKNEVRRYITIPGQACAYKIGELKIKSLRERAAKTLGSKFNVQEFHDEVLRHFGPLYMLEEKIIQFIKVKA